jgi:C4-dicarboxylate-binding protein DctP
MSMRHAALATLFVASFATTASAQQVRELRLGSPWPSTSTVHAALPVFAEAVERDSKGTIKIKVYPDSQLGDIQSLINGVQLGTVDMTYLAIGNAGVLKGGAALNVAYVPYLFKSKAGAEKVVNSPVFQELYDNLAKESGVRIFAVYGSRSPRAIQNRVRPITKPEDLKGLKIRSPGGAGISWRINLVGGIANTTAWPNVPLALSQGTFDGLVSTDESCATAKLWEAGVRYSYADHQYVGQYMPMISGAAWAKLSREQQNIMLDLWEANIGTYRANAFASQQHARELMQQNGVTFVDPTPEQAAAARKMMQANVESLIKDAKLSAEVVKAADEAAGSVG